jgi:hypothetical protein
MPWGMAGELSEIILNPSLQRFRFGLFVGTTNEYRSKFNLGRGTAAAPGR